MTLEIEKYLAGEMSEADRKDFERRLLDDPELASQTEEARHLLERLKNQLVREKIASVVGKGEWEQMNHDDKPGIWISWFGWSMLLVLSLIIWITRYGIKASSTEERAPTQESRSAPDKERIPDIKEIEAPVTPDPSGKQAKNQLAMQPPIKTPRLRGENTDKNDAWSQFMTSIWHTRFNENPADYGNRFSNIVTQLNTGNFTDAYVQLTGSALTGNDTLHFLKGYCLLELGEGAEAQSQFDQIREAGIWQQHLDWYRALASLLQGDITGAQDAAGEIVKIKDHDFHQDAAVLLQRLR